MKISIITITFQAEKFLEKTIQSVFAQTYPSIEYWIIDGASRDNTIAIAEKYAKQCPPNIVMHIQSEPDKGLYDAMNKGLQKATGDYVVFLNAGDYIASADVLEKSIDCAPNADVYFGETMCINEENQVIGLRSQITTQILPQKLTWKSLRYGMVVCHQAMIVRRAIAPFYRTKHRYSADIDWVIEVLKKAKKIQPTNIVMVNYLLGGFSQKHLRKSLIDRFWVLSRHFGFVPTLLRHFWIVLRAFFHKFLSRATFKSPATLMLSVMLFCITISIAS
ncbi:MAG: glycosyltransferase [Cytophagales bacterium]|nr:MAG: glycosyltransferase [Cytophagales bacterium]